MIASGVLTSAEAAVARLHDAVRPTGLVLHGLRVDPYVWESVRGGPTRLVELGCLTPESARQLASVIRQGAMR